MAAVSGCHVGGAVCGAGDAFERRGWYCARDGSWAGSDLRRRLTGAAGTAYGGGVGHVITHACSCVAIITIVQLVGRASIDFVVAWCIASGVVRLQIFGWGTLQRIRRARSFAEGIENKGKKTEGARDWKWHKGRENNACPSYGHARDWLAKGQEYIKSACETRHRAAVGIEQHAGHGGVQWRSLALLTYTFNGKVRAEH
ncbi:hypothetical protein B0H19DRAFT_1225862 [Mycena capillaripes]|nr:hypothetical protein B0H19DRAFT_1225862 [Mycena capillaripes]